MWNPVFLVRAEEAVGTRKGDRSFPTCVDAFAFSEKIHFKIDMKRKYVGGEKWSPGRRAR